VLAPSPDPLPAPHPIQPVDRIGAAAEVILCSGFPSQLLLILVLRGLGYQMVTGAGRLSPSFVFTLSLADAVLVVGLVLLFLRAHRESVGAVLFGNRGVLWETAVGILLLPVIFLVVVLVLAAVLTFAPQLHNVPRNPLEDMLGNRRDAVIFVIVVMLAGGVREEVQRGFILHRFEGYLGGGVLGLVLYSILFGFGHLEQGHDAMIATAVLGGIWGSMYLVRRSIVASMVSHAGFNVAQLLKYLMVAART
jgi:membrane protease YdiL (CAAX protease family)